MELRNKERGSKGEWGEAKMNEWKYRRSKVFSFSAEFPVIIVLWLQSTKSQMFHIFSHFSGIEYSSVVENSSFTQL